MVTVSLSPSGFEIGDRLTSPLVDEILLPEDLEPIGDSGLYYMPEPVDPRDCERYPDSPFCGGFPLSTDLFSIEADISIDTCGRVRAVVSSTILFTNLPEQEFQYIPPDCRNPPPQEKTPTVSGEGRRFGSGDYGHMRNDKEYILAIDDGQDTTLKLRCGPVAVGVARVRQLNAREYQIVDPYPRPTIVVQGVPVSEVWRAKIYDRVPASRLASDAVELGELRTSSPNQRPFLISGRGGVIKRYLSGQCGIYTEEDTDFNPGFVNFPPFWGPDGPRPPFIAITKKLEDCREQNSSDPPPPGGDDDGDCDCMACCPDNTELLQKILKAIGEYPTTMEVFDSDETKEGIQKSQRPIASTREGIRLCVELSNRLSKIIGIDLLPFTLPESVVEKVDEGVLGEIWDFLTPDATTKIDSLMRAFRWQVLNDSAVLGSWQRKIEEKGDIPRNSDGTPELDDDGNQKPAPTQKMVLPDMASTMEELVRLDIRTQKTLGLMFDFIVKLQLECAGIKTAAAQTLLTAEDIQEYMDYPTSRKASQVPIQVTIPNPNASAEERNDLHKFEKPSKAFVGYEDWTGELSLQQQLNQILMVVRAVKGQNTGQ